MTAYDATVKRLRGENTDAFAAVVQAYIESLDSTTSALLDVSFVGDNNFVTCIISHLTT